MENNDAQIKNHPGFLAFWGKKRGIEDTQAEEMIEDKKELAEDKKYENK